MDNESNVSSHAPSQQRAQETYSYKGWLNSDVFLKRVFAIFGYGLVAQLILVIPIMAISGVVAWSVATMYGDRIEQLGPTMGLDDVVDDVPPPVPFALPGEPTTAMDDTTAMKGLRTACESALAYSTFPDSESADAFVEECAAGEHLEVIDRYLRDLGA